MKSPLASSFYWLEIRQPHHKLGTTECAPGCLAPENRPPVGLDYWSRHHQGHICANDTCRHTSMAIPLGIPLGRINLESLILCWKVCVCLCVCLCVYLYVCLCGHGCVMHTVEVPWHSSEVSALPPCFWGRVFLVYVALHTPTQLTANLPPLFKDTGIIDPSCWFWPFMGLRDWTQIVWPSFITNASPS